MMWQSSGDCITCVVPTINPLWSIFFPAVCECSDLVDITPEVDISFHASQITSPFCQMSADQVLTALQGLFSLERWTAAELSVASLASLFPYYVCFSKLFIVSPSAVECEWMCMPESVCVGVHTSWGVDSTLQISVLHVLAGGQRLGADLWCNRELISALLLADQPLRAVKPAMRGNPKTSALSIYL